MQPQEFVPCSGCSNNKLKGMALCHDCKKQYVAEAADIALAGNPVPTYEDWIEKRVLARIPEHEAALQQTQKNLSSIQKKAEEKLTERVIERVSGQKLSLEVFEAAKAKLKEKEKDNIWKEVGGGAIFREYKIASSRLQEARRLLKDLETKKNQNILIEYGEKIIQKK